MRRLCHALFLGMFLVGCKPGGDRAAVTAPLPQAESENGSLKRYWKVPQFLLVDQEGQPFRDSDMVGKLWVVDFFYTTCPGPCPALTSRLSEVHKAFVGEDRLGFLSISSDPEKDRPEVLKRYAEKFEADARWRFLTGDVAGVFSLANEGFKLSITKTEGGAEPVTHSTRLVLVDSEGFVRGFYEGVGEEGADGAARLTKGIQTLLKDLK